MKPKTRVGIILPIRVGTIVVLFLIAGLLTISKPSTGAFTTTEVVFLKQHKFFEIVEITPLEVKLLL